MKMISDSLFQGRVSSPTNRGETLFLFMKLEHHHPNITLLIINNAANMYKQCMVEVTIEHLKHIDLIWHTLKLALLIYQCFQKSRNGIFSINIIKISIHCFSYPVLSCAVSSGSFSDETFWEQYKSKEPSIKGWFFSVKIGGNSIILPLTLFARHLNKIRN